MKTHARQFLALFGMAATVLVGSASGEGLLEWPGAEGSRAVHELRVKDLVAPLKAFVRAPEASIHRLGKLSESEADELGGRAGLRSTTEGMRVGLVRTLPTPVGFADDQSRVHAGLSSVIGGGFLETSDAGRLTWTAGFESEAAGALRLLLEDVKLPAGTYAFVYGISGETHGPYDLGGGASEVWTNAVFSSRAYIEVQLPPGTTDLRGLRFRISSVVHMEHAWFAPSRGAGAQAEAQPVCFEDASCVQLDEFPSLDQASRAVAHISYRKGTGVFVCSGGLLNTTAGAGVPYFLTANHCIDDSQSAASVEAYWDYRTPSCGAGNISRSGVARTLGATLLATGSKQKGKADFSLLRLNEDPPAGRYYLGWSAAKESVTAGVALHRIAHPQGGPQSYSVHRVSATPTPGACDGLPTTRFIYSKNARGATHAGSSGAPVFLEDGLKVVGQLFGRCGRNLDDTCDVDANSSVDGAFATYFDEVKQWLDPPKQARCKPTAVTLCLTGGKFRVNVLARDMRTGRATTGTAIPQNDVFGYFSLPELTGHVENPEVFIKIVDGSSLNGKYWVFYGGLTDLQFVLEVTDMDSGITKTYAKDAGGYCGDSDTAAF